MIEEKMLLKALEHGRAAGAVYPAMCSVLGLQYFVEGSEQPVHTLGSPTFVIDICGQDLKLMFVSEDLTRYFRYVEFYLSHALRDRDLIGFYRRLRMLARMESGTEEFSEAPGICECMETGVYCTNPSFGAVQIQKSDGIYNIFTHRFEYHMHAGSFILPIPARSAKRATEPVKAEDARGKTKNTLISPNLAEYIDTKTISGEVFRVLGEGFYWEREVGWSSVLVQNSLAVYVNGDLQRDASFLMKLGKSLEFALGFFGCM